MDWDQIDWAALERLRKGFLDGSAAARDYWQSETDLASYDHTFAQRIGWKWDQVLDELRQRRWTPPLGEVLDWGCGSGVAGRAFLDVFGLQGTSSLQLWDRSSLATQFARSRAMERFPGLPVRVPNEIESPCQTLLVSHVLTELADSQLNRLLGIARKATAVIWVEPGTHSASRRLSAARDALLGGEFSMIAPCTHQSVCPMLSTENGAHWCHHFAAPPNEVFTDGNWTRFAQLAGIDLRSLSVSYLVLDKRPGSAFGTNAVRVIGRPRVYKAHALLWGCDASGLKERRLTRRALPEQFRSLKKRPAEPWQEWECAGDELVAARPVQDRS